MLAPLDKPKPGPSRLTDWLKSHSPLSQRLQQMHDDLLERTDVVDRIACALYDPVEDTLKTFINSTRHGKPIAGYEFKLSDSRSLYELAGTGRFRVLDDIPQVIQANNEHSRWLLDQGYRSSFTVPMYGNGALIGFGSAAGSYCALAVSWGNARQCGLPAIFLGGMGAGLGALVDAAISRQGVVFRAQAPVTWHLRPVRGGVAGAAALRW